MSDLPDDFFAPPATVAPGPRCDVDFILGDKGPFAEQVKGYEKRPGQMAYALAVEACLDPVRNPDRTPLLIEGPTGTGKTLGYLIPSIGSVLSNRFRRAPDPGEPAWKYRRRVLVVTSNIALQEQLIQKDLPFIRETTGWQFEYALLKGRSNFACHRAMKELATDPKGLFPDDAEAEVMRLREWFDASTTGDKSEIDPSPQGLAWSLCTSTSEDCTGKKCTFFDQCYYYQQRRAAWTSDVIVTNYAFLLTEIALRLEKGAPSILMPEFDIVICDEAHDLGDIARQFFAVELKATQFSQMGRLLNGPRLMLKAEADKAFAMARTWNDLAQQQLQTAVKGSTLYDPALFQNERKAFQQTLGEIIQGVRAKVGSYLRATGFSGASLSDLPDDAKRIVESMSRPQAMAENALELLDGVFPDPNAPPPEPMFDEDGDVVEVPKEKMVYYIDSFGGSDEGGDGRRKTHAFIACPLSAGGRLKAALWDTCERAILTSATLATRLKAPGTESRFGFVRVDLGLGSPTLCFEQIVESPFDFQKNMGVYIVSDLNPQEDRVGALADRITDLLRASRGRALVLFTSYQAMNEIHGLVSARVPFKCFRQGESSRSTLTKKFRDEVSSCLFATRSFFQGIDIQGESLSLLILDRIPFPMMNDPFIETVKREGERTGKNKWGWFDGHSIPRAMMAFRQATGRLIRTQSDRGVVAVLDSRISAVGGKNYGRQFRDALPSTQYLDTVDDVAEFFGTVSEPEPQTKPDYNNPHYDDDIPF